MRVSMCPKAISLILRRKWLHHCPKSRFLPSGSLRWLRIRPYVYMAAMFAGVWCMGYLFKDLKTRSGEIAAEGQIAEAMKDKDMWNELEKSGTVSIDDLLNDTIGIDTSMDFDTTAN